jgi:hypothetical protein
MCSADSADISDDEICQVSTDYLHTPNPGNFPPSKMTLRVGCNIMLLRNLNPGKEIKQWYQIGSEGNRQLGS